MREEEGRLFPHFGNEFVQVVGRGGAVARLDALGIRHVLQQAVVVVVDELAFLAFAQALHREGKLLLDLVVGRTEDIRHLCVDIDDGGDRVEDVFARLLLIVDEALRDGVALGFGTAKHFQRRIAFLYAVDAVDTGIQALEFQKSGEPFRRQQPELRFGFRYICQLVSRSLPQRIDFD